MQIVLLDGKTPRDIACASVVRDEGTGKICGIFKDWEQSEIGIFAMDGAKEVAELLFLILKGK